MKKLCELYVAKAGRIGAWYCLVPTLIAFGAMFALMPFRSVYLVRLAMVLLVGVPIAGYLNRFGLSLWLIKHASPQGPATVLDGCLIGGGLGLGMAVIPGLVHLLGSTDLDRTKTVIIILWLSAGLAGALMGGMLAAVGRKHFERKLG